MEVCQLMVPHLELIQTAFYVTGYLVLLSITVHPPCSLIVAGVIWMHDILLIQQKALVQPQLINSTCQATFNALLSLQVLETICLETF